MGSIVIVSGPVGAGKTTVARELARSSPAPSAFIEGDAFWFFIAQPGPGRPRQRHFQTILRAMFRAAAAFAGDGFEVILDFSMPPDFAKRAVERLTDTPAHLVILYPDEAVCAERAASRSEGVIEDYAPYSDFYRFFEADERHVIRNDLIEAPAAAAIVRRGLNAGRFLISKAT